MTQLRYQSSRLKKVGRLIRKVSLKKVKEHSKSHQNESFSIMVLLTNEYFYLKCLQVQ